MAIELEVPKETKEALEALVSAQREESAGGQTPSSGGELPDEMLASFLKHPAFSMLYAEARSLSGEPDRLKTDILNRCFVGALYQELAYLWLRDRIRNGSTLLSSTRVLSFYEKLYPPGRNGFARRLRHPFGQTSLHGISVPDMLVIDRGLRIKVSVEATLSPSPEYFERKALGLRMAQRGHPALFDRARLQIVFPRREEGDPLNKTLEDYAEELGIDTPRLPFTTRDTRNFFDYVIYRYRTRRGKSTLIELQRKHEPPLLGNQPNPC